MIGARTARDAPARRSETRAMTICLVIAAWGLIKSLGLIAQAA